jgi:hypothetical protein
MSANELTESFASNQSARWETKAGGTQRSPLGRWSGQDLKRLTELHSENFLEELVKMKTILENSASVICRHCSKMLPLDDSLFDHI